MSDLLRAYRATQYEIGGCVARIGRRSRSTDAVLEALGARRGIILGAWNPRSRRLGGAVNARRHACLGALLARRKHAAGWGTNGAWGEPHFLVTGDPRPALRLARMFRQRAVVALRHGAPARLVMLA